MTEHERFENYAAWHEAWKQQQKRIYAIEQQRDKLLEALKWFVSRVEFGGVRSKITLKEFKGLIAEIEATK